MMKRLFFYIVCILAIFNASVAEAQKYVLPADFEGQLTQQRLEQLQKGTATPLDAGEYGSILWEIGEYFYKKYPDTSVFYEDNFIDNLRPFFPQDNDEELLSRLVLLRNIIDGYRVGSGIYNDVIKQKLVPHVYKKVHRPQDFDDAQEVPYIAAEDGEFVKVYNFKKFLTYAENPDEPKAINEFKKKQQQEPSFWDKVQYAADKIEWKKLPLYGDIYKNPLLSDKGVTDFVNGKYVQLRLLSPQTYIEGQKELNIGVHILTDSRHFVLANNVDDELQKIKISLDNSENVTSYEVLYPIPFRSGALPAYHKYFGDFLIPIKLTLQDENKPLKVNANVEMTVCNAIEMCQSEKFALALTLEPKGEDIFPNGYENFFSATMSQNPKAETAKLKLEKFVVDDDADGQSLRLEFSALEKVESFQVYVEENDGYTTFGAPLISLSDERIFVRFLPQKPLKYDLAGTEFTISAGLNDHYYLRQSRFAERASLFDTRSVKLNFGLIFLAFFGGLLLNFMPCVFPVLSLKIMAISQNLENSVALKRSLKFTICGIFLGFVIIICGVILAKVVGLSLGWGMQYQSVSFLVVMIFVITAFYILAPQLDFGAAVKYVGADVLLGTLIVLLATPCTGPYLATAIGFALTGSYVDIVVLLSAVAVGLSVPYWVILALDNPQDMFPKPGAWMNKLSIILKLLLLATIGWFLVLIFEQTNIVCVIKICGILLVFALLCRFSGSFMRFLDDEAEKQIPTETAIWVRQKSKYVLLIVCALLLAVSVLIAHNAFEANYARRLQERQTAVDMPLIKNKLAQGRSVLLEIGADWCLTCHYNSAMVLTPKNLAYWKEFLHLDLVRVDWTDYNAQTLEFMAQYGRKGLPFYVLFTPLIREGIVLPEIFDADDIRHLLTTYH